jgi:putative flippase GtrA
MPKIPNHFPKVALYLSVGLFLLSLLNDGYYAEGQSSPAWLLLLIGWIGVFSGTLAWLANPLLIGAWILLLCKRTSLSLIAALVAMAFMLTFLFQKTVISSEAPTYSRISGYGLGYGLWIASTLAQIIGTAIATSRTFVANRVDT